MGRERSFGRPTGEEDALNARRIILPHRQNHSETTYSAVERDFAVRNLLISGNFDNRSTISGIIFGKNIDWL